MTLTPMTLSDLGLDLSCLKICKLHTLENTARIG